MTSVTLIRFAGESGIRKHNEALRVKYSGSNAPFPQGFSPLSSACLYLRTQSSTPCAMLEKSRDSTLDFRYSIISSGRETVSEIFLEPLDIQGKSSKLLLNISKYVKATSSKLLDGALQNDGDQPISGSYGGDQDDKEIRGDPSGGKQDSDSVSGAEHPCSSLGCADPFLGAGVGFTHEEGRFCGGVYPVQLSIQRTIT